MCGIIGYIGNKNVVPLLLEGLFRLEYRGYDSAGISVYSYENDEITTRKAVGRVSKLQQKVAKNDIKSNIGIAHTRWATHGKVTNANAHPHTNSDGSIALVHNGVIENSEALKEELTSAGYKFISNTDTEVLAQLIDLHYNDLKNPLEAVKQAINRIQGTFGIAVLFRDFPDRLITARLGSPLILGIGKNETFVASDVQALISYTKKIIHLEDSNIAVLKSDDIEISRFSGEKVNYHLETLNEEFNIPDLKGFPHYLIKEIMEQPQSLRSCMAGRIDAKNGMARLGGLNIPDNKWSKINQIVAIGCGTGYHAGMITAMIIEHLVGLPAKPELAVDMGSRKIIPNENAMYLMFSQSGETADLISLAKELLIKNCSTYGVINVAGSTLARLCGKGVYIHAGVEIAVASTKAYTCQIVAGVLIAMMIGRRGLMTQNEGNVVAEELIKIPQKMSDYLDNPGNIIEIAEILVKAKYVFFIGRGFSYPVALEGALKFKEECYVPCTGYHAGEMKHGPIAMIEDGMPVVVIVPNDSERKKTLVSIAEAKARGSMIISICTTGDKEVENLSDYCVFVPKTKDYLTPLLTSIPLQLISYYAALKVNADPDKPRNLAKSVTVA